MSIQYWNPTAMVAFARSLIWTIPGAIGMVAYVYLVGKLTNQVTSKGNNWLKKGIQQGAQVIKKQNICPRGD